MATLLVLDDLADAARLIRRILSAQGYEVTAFTEEAEALDYAGRHPVDLAILDIRLKTMSGMDVLARMKQIRPSIHAIILTGYPTEESHRQAASLGADAYCHKPIDTDEMERTVAAVLSGKTGERQGRC